MRRSITALVALLVASAGLTASVGPGSAAATWTQTAMTLGPTAMTPEGRTAGSASTATTVATVPARPGRCAHRWGSLPKVRHDTERSPLMWVRTGEHACYDRLVLDVSAPPGEPIGYRVAYVDDLRQDGSGQVLKVGGEAVLEIRVAAPTQDAENGEVTYAARSGQSLPGVDVSGYRTFRDVRFGGSYEGDSQIGLGLRSRLPFRVFQWGNHLVVDVAHNWRSLG
ncbi:hypothetical protein AB0K09_09040 [Streptomyces sp. NPDC049577]|uniref:AMIN-like domain-containing (lipo)protein n=1 Tax=Streptomyces sp. NPDC049577 TaxID=3155153 RepID=UPI003422D625